MHTWNRHILLASLLLAVPLVLLACTEPPRGIPNKTELYLFDPFALQTRQLTQEMLTPVPSSAIREREVITGSESLVADEDVLFHLANSLVHGDERVTFQLRQVNFEWTPCSRSLEGVTKAYFAFLAESEDGPPDSPFEFASVTISTRRGYLSFSSDFLQPHDPLTQGALLSAYPPPVPYRTAMRVALDNGGKEAMQQIGVGCRLGVTLRENVWIIAWFPQDFHHSNALLVQEIDANTEGVRKVEWREDKK